MSIIRYRNNYGEIEELTTIKGEKGDKGDKGDTGETGEIIIYPDGVEVFVGRYIPEALKYRVLMCQVGVPGDVPSGTVILNRQNNESGLAVYSGNGVVVGSNDIPAVCSVGLKIVTDRELGYVGDVHSVSCKITYYNPQTGDKTTGDGLCVIVGVYGLLT